MLDKTENILYNVNANLFASQICEKVKDACEQFFEQDVKITLQAVNNYRELREEKLVTNIDFFTSQIRVENHKPVLIRLSKEFVENILETTLLDSVNRFNFSKITPLEIKILNAFTEFTYKKIKDILLSPKEAKLSEESEKNITLIFLVLTKNQICSKLTISIPKDRIKLETLKKVRNFQDEDFLTSCATVNIRAGSSKITFDELQNLTQDDIIVLDDSDLNKMTLISGETEDKFNIKINSSLIVNLNNDDEEENEENYENTQTYDEVQMEKNLWDDIQIEINAEFDKVKMTIGELKEITQGQIVDLGSIFENEISLYVENKKVAKGELIIINDRYAVRLNQVLNSNAKKISTDAKIKLEPKKEAKPIQSTKSQETEAKKQADKQTDEEFDYSDFEK